MPPNPSARGLSRISNGKLFATAIDQRSRTARRLRDLIKIFSRPFGGMDACDETTRQLIRRAAMLSVQAEMLETQSAAGGSINPIHYATIANSLSRILRKLEVRSEGAVKRQPTLAELLAADERGETA